MRENNSKISGILSIISGSLGLLGFLMMVLVMLVLSFVPEMAGMGRAFDAETKNGLLIAQVTIAISGIFTLALSILSIIGGAYALKRKYWGLGLAAAISSILIIFVTGIPAIIFHIMAKNEFQPQEPVQVPVTQ
jgi:peptidoglycan biosynthesis protein MviN/MurJ (putative lipid II flippase)